MLYYLGNKICIAFLDGLCLNSTKYMILDWNWRDQKLRRMMDIPEVLYKHLCILYSLYSVLLILVPRSWLVRIYFCKDNFSGLETQRSQHFTWKSVLSGLNIMSCGSFCCCCCCRSQLCCEFLLFMLGSCSACSWAILSVRGLCAQVSSKTKYNFGEAFIGLYLRVR